MTSPAHLTQKEYAALRGCAPSAVTKAVQAGRITLVILNGKKMVDVALADRQWSQNTRARGDSRSAAPLGTPVGLHHFPDASKMVAGQGAHHSEGLLDMVAQVQFGAEPEEAMSYEVARRRREAAEARIAEMKQAEMEGSLIRVDSVRSSFATKISGARDALLQIPSRLAPVLAAEGDMLKVTAVLEGELRQALADLSGAGV